MVAKSGHLHVAGVTQDTHTKLKVYSAMINKPQGAALDRALQVAVRCNCDAKINE